MRKYSLKVRSEIQGQPSLQTVEANQIPSQWRQFPGESEHVSVCRGRSSSVIPYLQQQLCVWLIWAQGITRAKELRTAEAEALVISPFSEIVCLFCPVFRLPAHPEVQFFPDQEFLGAEKRQHAA